MEQKLMLRDLVVEHQKSPLGIDCSEPRFGWKLVSSEKNVCQTAYQLKVYADGVLAADTGKVECEDSIEVMIQGWQTKPMTEYHVQVTVWNNNGNSAETETSFETGRLGIPFTASWVEPEQIPTPNSWLGKDMNSDSVSDNTFAGKERDFAEFQKVQYIRIPFELKKAVKKARVYATVHGVYQFEVNGMRPDDREFAPDNTSYHKILQYQTYDVTEYMKEGKNAFGVIIGDGWWAGRVGVSGDSCQFGDKLGLLLEAVVQYEDGTEEMITGEQGVSSTGPIIFSDLFVGEKYDARCELSGWSEPDYDDSLWKPVKMAEYPMNNLVGQCDPPVRVVKVLTPEAILHSPKGEVIVDVGQVVAGQVEFTVEAPEGVLITLEHSEILDEEGNYFNNILGTNKEQTVFYITKDGKQTFRPHFTYHGFRYVRVTGWPGEISTEQFKIRVVTSEMDDIGYFETSDERINRLQQNIWWSQVANTISIPTDCPQREKAGWTGDIMAYAPAYYAFSAKTMAEVSKILGKEEDAAYYQDLYEKIRQAFIEEYVHEDGTMDTNFQGMYVIALKNNLVPEEIKPKMVEHLCKMLEENNDCLDTGFLSILFLMDVLCENGKRDVAYKLMFQTKCPSWLYEVEKGATTMWESWGAIAEDGMVSTYSYNHYAFGCVGEWMYREMGGLQAAAPGYKKIRVAPALDCGLTWAKVKEETPYGTASVAWKKEAGNTTIEVEIPANTTAEIVLPGKDTEMVGSGTYVFHISRENENK